MSSTNALADSLIAKTGGLDWQERLQALAAYPEVRVAFSTSFSKEDQAILHAIAEAGLKVEIFTLDTGRHFEETYTLQQQSEVRYGTAIKSYYPDPLALEKYVQACGVNGFYESVENRKACCFIRKVEPLTRALDGVDIWISGLRREHSEQRTEYALAEWDKSHQLTKFYPLIDVDQAELDAFIQAEDVPISELYAKGYTSIGCEPCTRATQPDEHPRAGRWWWEQGAVNECGLHMKDGKLVSVHVK